jgi:hypothetical protein
MKILIACEFSGIVREAFKKRGHNVWSCDLIDTEIPGQHIIGNVLDILDAGWDMMIAHPPCQYLANSGLRWFYNDFYVNNDRFIELGKAIDFFNKLLNSNINKICIENSIQHHYSRRGIIKYDQIIHPWQFGHGETKATCLWLKELPKLIPTNIVSEREARIHKMPPSKNRQKNRSRTFQGIANAMAEQWG